MMLRLTITVLAGLVALVGCGPGDLQVPAPPNLDAIVAVYEHPPGQVDQAHVQQTLADAQARLQELHLDWLPSLVAEVAARLRQRLQDNGLPVDPTARPDRNRRAIDAVVRINHVCAGLTDPPGPPAPQTNGTIDLTATVKQGYLERTIWGTASNCQERITVGNHVTADAHLNGTLILYLYGPLPEDPSQLSLLVRVERPATAAADAALTTSQSSSGFDFRVLSSAVEFRLPQPSGDVVVGVGSGTLTLRGSNQTVVCTVGSNTCSPGTGA